MSVEGTRVIVTDAHANPALAAVRSLGARGARVTVVAEQGRLNLAGASRHASGVIMAPPAASCPHAYADALTRELESRRYDLLLPITDTTLAIVEQRREALDRLTRVALPGSEQLRLATDKLATLQLARDAGVAVPHTRVFRSVEEALDRAGDVTYPAVIKSRFSRQWSGEGPVQHGPVRFVSSADMFREAYPKLHRPDAAPLVQEFVRGTGVGVFALVDRGRVITTFAHRRLREVNPTGGPASLCESLAPDERLLAPARRLLERARWHGVAMVEFKDPGAGAPWLMELNGRLWGSLPLAVAAGVDFPVLLAELFLGRTPAAPPAYRVGVRCRHLRGDLSYLGGVLRGAPPGWPDRFPTPIEALAAIVPWPGRWTPYNLRVTDAGPSVAEFWRFVKDEMKAAASHEPSDRMSPSTHP